MFAAENGLKGDPRLEAISAAIRVVPNFPKKGLFKKTSSFLCFRFFTTHHLVFWSEPSSCCFSRTGIMFQDITTLLLDHKAFKHTIDIFVDRYKDMQISVVAGKKKLLYFILFFLFLSTVFRHQVC